MNVHTPPSSLPPGPARVRGKNPVPLPVRLIIDGAAVVGVAVLVKVFIGWLHG